MHVTQQYNALCWMKKFKNVHLELQAGILVCRAVKV